MKRGSAVFAMCLATLVAIPASAQERAQERFDKPNEKKKGPVITVDGFSPNQGEVGTEVTIHGKGFSPRMQLLLGGRPVKPKQVRPEAIVFEVPGAHGDGTIVLRHPEVARDIQVGTFSLVTTVRITGFAPQSGIPGTRVEIAGSGFGKDDRVLMNGNEVHINRSTPGRLVITIPDNATTDHLTVLTPSGQATRTQAAFDVRIPAPAISGFSPERGLPGTQVRITGQNFSNNAQVLYAKLTLAVTSRSNDSLEVVIPASARGDDFFTISGPNGQARSTRKFELQKPASVKRITPASGKAGTSVQIIGSGFLPGDRVTLGGLALEVLLLRPTQITVRIPTGAQSGPLMVERDPMKVESPQHFQMEAAPIVEDFSPAGGKAGSQVTITGQNFSRDAIVYYGTQKLGVLRRAGTNTLVVKIPAKAADQVFVVHTRAGQASAAQPFQVHVFPVLASIEPVRGVPGTRVTLRGTNLHNVHAVSLGDAPLTIVERAPAQAVVEIPLGTRSGLIQVQSFDKWLPSKLRFDVLEGPTITGFAPQAGPPGSQIIIEGTGFTPETVVLFGDTQLTPTLLEATRVEARIPASARPSRYYLRARNGLSETRSTVQFRVTAPAAITGFTPERAEAGTTVVIRGKNFTATTKVLWGNVALSVRRVGPDGDRLEVEIPRQVVGAHYLIVEEGGARTRSAAMLEVLTPAPRRGQTNRDHRKSP
jgi:hypothetical protein